MAVSRRVMESANISELLAKSMKLFAWGRNIKDKFGGEILALLI